MALLLSFLPPFVVDFFSFCEQLCFSKQRIFAATWWLFGVVVARYVIGDIGLGAYLWRCRSLIGGGDNASRVYFQPCV